MSAQLTPDVRDVLERSAFDGGVLRLPDGQLDRKLYVSVNAAIEALGGKWNKKAKGHVFATDAADKLTTMLGSGVVPPKNPDAFFPTPRAVVDEMIQLAGLDNHAYVLLEPSAGTGAIADVVRARFPAVTVLCVESNEERASGLIDRFLHVWQSDFLQWDSDYYPEWPDVVLMNPPFAVERDASEWMAHVRHAHGMLPQHGLLVSVVPNSYRFRTDKKHVAFRAWAESHGAVVVELPDDSFKESGTGVSAFLLSIRAGAPTSEGRERDR